MAGDMTTYERATEEDTMLLNDMVENMDNELKHYHVRMTLLYVTTEDKDGFVWPTFKSLPYKVKLNDARDRLLKNIDVEIQLDTEYWNQLTDVNEKNAVLEGALSQIEVVYKKDFPVHHSDGTLKMRLLKPDMTYEGFSQIAKKYKLDSPELKKFKHLQSEYEDVLI